MVIIRQAPIFLTLFLSAGHWAVNKLLKSQHRVQRQRENNMAKDNDNDNANDNANDKANKNAMGQVVRGECGYRTLLPSSPSSLLEC